MEKIRKYRLKKLTELEYIAVKMLIQSMQGKTYKRLNDMPDGLLKALASNLGYFRPNRQKYFNSLRMQMLDAHTGNLMPDENTIDNESTTPS